MNKLLNKKQILILSVLSVATLTLALCMWAAGIFDPAKPASGNEAAVWETVREARPSLNEDVLWENRLGGTGEESLVAAYAHNERIIVFGNTDSSDCDFTREGYHGFIAVLSDTGTTQSFVETDPICAVALHEQGFLLGLGGVSARLRLIDFDLGLVSETPLYSTLDEEIVDIVLTDDGYTVVTAVQNTVTSSDSLRVIFYDENLKKITTSLLSRSAKLEYIDLFALPGKTVVAVNFVSGAVSCLTLVVLSGGSPVYYDLNLTGGYTACDILPYADGFAALILADGSADILTINKDYAAAKRIYLNSADCTSGKLIVSDNRLYAYVHKNGDMSQLCELDTALNYLGIIPQANVYTAAHAYFTQGDYTNILCSAQDKTVVLSLGPQQKTVEIRVETKNCLWLRSDKGLIIVAESLSGEDCPGQIGGKDISVIRLAR